MEKSCSEAAEGAGVSTESRRRNDECSDAVALQHSNAGYDYGESLGAKGRQPEECKWVEADGRWVRVAIPNRADRITVYEGP